MEYLKFVFLVFTQVNDNSQVKPANSNLIALWCLVKHQQQG